MKIYIIHLDMQSSRLAAYYHIVTSVGGRGGTGYKRIRQSIISSDILASHT